MIFSRVVSAITGSLTLWQPTTDSPIHCAVPDRSYLKKIKDQYLELWNGEFSLLNKTLSPTVHLYQDRVPNANGTEVLSINSSSDFLSFMKRAHEGWEKYVFEEMYWAGDGYTVVIRWKLDAIMGAHFPARIPTTLKDGDPVTYNGTDFLQLDPCTWLVKQVDSAQDFVTLFRNLGLPGIKL